MVEHANGVDQEARDEQGTVSSSDLPSTAETVPVGGDDLCVESDVVGDSQPVTGAAKVIVDLWLRGKQLPPIGVLRKRKRVQRCRDVACAAWVCVVTPGPTDIVSLLEHDIRAAGELFDLRCGRQSREAGTDDDYVGGGFRPARSVAWGVYRGNLSAPLRIAQLRRVRLPGVRRILCSGPTPLPRNYRCRPTVFSPAPQSTRKL